MKHLIKVTVIVLIVSLFTSCTKDEEYGQKLYYDYNPNQETVIEFDLIPVGDVHVNFEDLNLEVNADYYNRYGIFIKINLLPAVPESEGPLKGCSSVIKEDRKIYVVDFNYLTSVNDNGIAGYACDAANFAVVGDMHQTTRTLAHEIAHSLGVDHVDIPNNVMKIYERAGQYDIPNDFEPFQIDIMLENIEFEKEQLEKYRNYGN